jgi:hypothetical protein
MAKQSYERKELAAMRELNRKNRDAERAKARKAKAGAVVYKPFAK